RAGRYRRQEAFAARHLRGVGRARPGGEARPGAAAQRADARPHHLRQSEIRPLRADARRGLYPGPRHRPVALALAAGERTRRTRWRTQDLTFVPYLPELSPSQTARYI